MKKIIAALISLTLFYSSTVCIFAIENQECPYYEEITDVIELKKGPVLYLNEKRNDTYWEFSDNEEAFKTINSLEHDLISILSTNYNLDNLEKSNWLDYKNALENERVKDVVTEVELNQNIEIGKARCEILGIKNPEITTNAINNSSMIIKMYFERKTVLFLGDTGAESSEKLIKNESKKLESDIVQMAHHGQNGATEELYKLIKPKICLWPTPEWLWNNDKGEGEDTGNWKTKETRKWMEELNVKQNIIEKDGNQTIVI